MEFKELIKTKIDELKGEFFQVSFIKRTTGELRVMRCRKGVKKHLKGGERAYEFEDHGLVSVFDLDKGAYRCIPLENIVELRADGEIFSESAN